MRIPTAAGVAAIVVPLALSGCSATQPATAPAVGGDIAVTADETNCAATRDTAPTGNVTFQVTNGGQRVTEFYVYATGDRVVGEVENIGPGQSRRLIVAMTEPGTYQVSCRPGMTGAGIRHPFTVTGYAAQAAAAARTVLSQRIDALSAVVSQAQPIVAQG